ncbi:MAG: hypothetical protein GX147_02700 [Deltaproteobacteria bacterium]|nr:hypothetical protein [Deltaproteobacteria bacterium]
MFLSGLKAFFLVSSLLGFLILVSLGLISLFLGRKNPTNYFFAGVCFLGALFNGNFVLVSLLDSPRIALLVYRLVYCPFVFTLPLYIRFTHAFLGINTRRVVERIAFSVSAVFIAFLPFDLFFNGFYEHGFGRVARGGPVFLLFAVAAIVSVLYCLATLVYSGKRAVDNQKKNRIKYVTGGLGFGALLLSFNVFPVMGFQVYPFGHFNFVPAIILAFGVLKYDLLDMGVLIRRGTTYFILTGVLVVIYLALLYFMSYFLMVSGYRNSMLALILAITIVVLVDPLKGRIKKWLDHVFFMGRYDYREILKETSRRLNRMRKTTEVRDLLLDSILHHIRLRSIYLLMKEGSSGEIRFFEKGDLRLPSHPEKNPENVRRLFSCLERMSATAAMSRTSLERVLPDHPDKKGTMALMHALGVVAVVPLVAKEGLMGAILLGEKFSGELFVHEDLEVLMTMANQAVTAFENALFFERLEVLNQNLESRVAERTAALREALAEKERTEAQLIRSESLAAIGQLVAGTAHELNNPLSSASSLIQSTLESVMIPYESKANREVMIEDLTFSLKELRRAGHIVRSLLDLSRQTDNYRERVRIHDVIDDALRVLQNICKSFPVYIEKRYAEFLPEMDGNFSALGQVMVNLIRNAIQSLPKKGGRIFLSTWYDEEAGDVIVSCADTGHGIPERSLRDIFKPFFTTKEVGEGTGLGLYLSHELIRRHGGNISVESRVGEGSSFTIRLPTTGREK